MDRLAETCERAASHASRRKKTALLAAWFGELGDDDLARAADFLSGKSRLPIGHATLRAAAMAATGWDLETFRVCRRVVGETGETIALLLGGRPGAEPFPLARAGEVRAELARARSSADRIELLREVFERHRPLAVKYFLRCLAGSLRAGLERHRIEDALAASEGLRAAEVRRANNRAGDLPRVALACRRGGLQALEARLFHPLEFMLARPLGSLAELDGPDGWWAEDKFRGLRAQIHVENGRVGIYTRGLEDVTAAFPEVARAMGKLTGAVILDGHLAAIRDGRILPCNALQQRLERKKVAPPAQAPVAYIAYDLLYRDGLLLETPFEQRRRLLEELPVEFSPRHAISSAGEAERLFAAACARGNEGLLLKRRGSLYEAGRRGGAWLKLERAHATLDVVVTAARKGTGPRAAMLADYTFGVRAGEGYVNAGQTASGLPTEEVRELNRRLRAATSGRFGGVFLVRPEIVLEVAFDGVRKSPRHKGGYALRSPRIVCWRRDKRPEECATIERLKELYEASLE